MLRLGLAVVLSVALAAPAVHAAEPAVVTGKLKGAKLPAAGKGRVPVWAVRIRDGVVAAATDASPSGRFTLKPPAGSYAIMASVVPASRRAKAVHRVADFVRAKAGKRRTIKPTLKPRRKRAKAAGAPGARAAWVDVDYPVVWVHTWATTDPLFKHFERGMRDMLITDLGAVLGGPSCRGAISAGDDLPLVMAEIGRSQSRYFDPSTRMTTRNLLRPNASVTGTLRRAGGQLTLTATYTDQRSGRSATTSVAGPEDDIFSLEQRLAAQVAELVCTEIPTAYAGTFSGSYTTQLNRYTVTWTGDAILERTAEHGPPPTDGPPPADYAHYKVRSGTFHAVLDGTRGTCAAHGEADIALVPDVTTGETFVQAAGGQPWFALTISAPATATIPYTETGTGCQTNAEYPLTGLQVAFTPKPLQASDRRHLTANTAWDQFTFSHFTSSFTFAASE